MCCKPRLYQCKKTVKLPKCIHGIRHHPGMYFGFSIPPKPPFDDIIATKGDDKASDVVATTRAQVMVDPTGSF